MILDAYYFLFDNVHYVGSELSLFFDSHVNDILAFTGLLLTLILLRLIFKRR